MSLDKIEEVNDLEEDLIFLCNLSEWCLETKGGLHLSEPLARSYGLRLKGAVERLQGALGKSPAYGQRSLCRDIANAIVSMSPNDRFVLGQALQDLDRKEAKDGNTQAD